MHTRLLAIAALGIASGCLIPRPGLAQGESQTGPPPAHVTWCVGASCMGPGNDNYYPTQGTWCLGPQCLGHDQEGHYATQGATWCFGAQCMGGGTEAYYPVMGAPTGKATAAR